MIYLESFMFPFRKGILLKKNVYKNKHSFYHQITEFAKIVPSFCEINGKFCFFFLQRNLFNVLEVCSVRDHLPLFLKCIISHFVE